MRYAPCMLHILKNSVGCGVEGIHNTKALLERSVQWWFGSGEDPPVPTVTSTKQTFETKTVHEPLEKFKEKKMGKDWARMDRVERGLSSKCLPMSACCRGLFFF